MEKLSSNLKNMLISLVGICLVVAAILAFINQTTEESIDKTKLEEKLSAIREVTPKFDNNPYEDKFEVSLPEGGNPITVYPAKLNGQIVGYAIDSYTEKGFSGHISIMVGYDNNDNIVSYKVLEMAETPGLGSKMVDFFKSKSSGENAIRNMEGLNMAKAGELKVSKDGGNVDAISAATISSRAFLDAVNRSYEVYKKVKANGGK